MEVFDSLNCLKEIKKNSKKIPMSEMIIVNKYELLDALEMIKKSLPIELEEAKKVMEYKNTILIEANREAETLLKEAQEYVSNQVNSHEVTKQAESGAEELMNRARINARELRIGAREYSSNLLLELQAQLEMSQEKLIENLENDYNIFLKTIQQEYRESIGSIKGNMEELKKLK